MAAPLTPTPSAALNYSTTPASLRHGAFDAREPADNNTENRNNDDEPDSSSPFMSHIRDEITSPTQRGPSPPKARPGSRIISGSGLSPLKILQQHQQSQIEAQTQSQSPSPQPAEEVSSPAKSMPPPPLPQSPRKSAPIKRFPVKISQPGSSRSESPRRPSDERRSSGERQASLPEVREEVRENEGLKHVIDIFEDDDNAMHDDPDGVDHDGDHTMSMGHEAVYDQSRIAEEDHSAADDTMMSTFSAFSTVPNLTMLANTRSDSPTKFSATGGSTPRASGRSEDSSALRTPRGNGSYDNGNSTTNLMDFTEQMRYGTYGAQPTPSRRGGQTAQSARTPNGVGTPQRNNLVNLLDFDIPPAPTPRSIPTITPRELESLKSGFLSEISSLKASLSGKEAEVLSLKTAVGDAEKRVGECLEQLREVEGVQGALQTEKDSWERRGREMETVLRKVREEIVMSQREREELEFKLDEAEKRREAAEMMAQDAESKMAGMRAVEIAVERVARELHALYKSKHETKVAALKKSYEHRWEKQVRKLQAQVDQLNHDNDELRHSNNNHNRGGIDPARLAEMEEERRADKARDAARVRELEAEVEKVEAVLKTVQADNADLRVLLERERVEKGELVMLAEEMMNMQQSFVASVPEEPEPAPTPAPAPAQSHYAQQQHYQQQQQQQHPAPPPVTAKTPNRRLSSSLATSARTPGTTTAAGAGGGGNPSFRMSTGPTSFRASGLRAPGGSMGLGLGKPAESRIGRMAHERTKSAAVGHGTGGGGWWWFAAAGVGVGVAEWDHEFN
ncbi:hypothetical protein CHGG_00575 [Chaetomium globosum CBS 148.51]|uniref:Uncharacterized protein n=1 Tax=Chaetomium globosum (strain ATCC 6205 / CBS 148.51 / DSM 1962 / NBRC 6347 / NRRL 1970) TaxID=306901 RepID=Q2HGS9_CHAGB|nr:uncharacterized protein CHGG_00575 [Chaetomium globosum CBS 148.51]EAQ92340.1 hypothetical protein CHGG_00575 [Chaetomium globosum CBS 148.51]